MSVVLPFIWLIVFLFLIWKLPFFKLQGIATWVIFAIFAGKLAASGVLHYIYTNYYPDRATADIFKYFDDAVVLFHSLHQSVEDFLRILFGINCDTPEMFHYFRDTNHWTRMYEYAPFLDNRLIIRTNMILLFVSGGNIAVHYMFANFISLIGFLLIYKTFESFYGKNILALLLITLMPSSVLWTAGILKECLATFALGCATYGFFNCARKHLCFSTICCFLIGLLLLVVLKFYILVAFVPAVIAWIFVEKCNIRRKSLCYTLLYLIGILAVGILDFGTHTIPFFESFAGKRTDAINSAILYNAQSIIPIEKLDATVWNFLQATPKAVWNALALPYVWDTHGLVQLVPALESILFFILLILWILYPIQPDESQRNFILFCVFFSLVLMWEIGISTAVVGGIVRYKIPIFPFLYTTIALLINWKKFTKFVFAITTRK
ncbi:MAG: hypothetical protein IKP08_01980 [Bacteroidales bacterium]|nr:hypothetical protein [Bacteroidales bacterium]